jgi:hypothetical protein
MVTGIGQTRSDLFTPRFTLSWSRYVFLMNIGNRDEHRFYGIESGQISCGRHRPREEKDPGIIFSP